MLKELNIDSSQTPEKFKPLMEEALTFLLDNLKALDKLEKEIFERHEILKAQRTAPNQMHPDEKNLWQEYARRCEEIISPISLKPYKGNTRSFGKPTKYEYLSYLDTKIIFTMKTATRVVVEMYFEYGIKKKEQFVLKKDGDAWKIDSKKYGFGDNETWWKCDV